MNSHLFVFICNCKISQIQTYDSLIPTLFLTCNTTKNANRWESHILKRFRDCTEIFNSEKRTYFAKIFILLCPLLKIVVHLHRKLAPRDKSNSLRSWKVTSWWWCASAWELFAIAHEKLFTTFMIVTAWGVIRFTHETAARREPAPLVRETLQPWNKPAGLTIQCN